MKIPQLKAGATGTLTIIRKTDYLDSPERNREVKSETPFTILEVRTKDFITNWAIKGASSRVFGNLPVNQKRPAFDESNESAFWEEAESTPTGFKKIIHYESIRVGQRSQGIDTFDYSFNV